MHKYFTFFDFLITGLICPSFCSKYYVFHFQYRWDYFPEQFSDPVYLEAGQHYFFQVLANQYPGPWDVGLAAKIHSLNHTSYPYQGDREIQRINISSTVVREKIVSQF